MKTIFVHPKYKTKLVEDRNRTLSCSVDNITYNYECYDSCYDFATINPNANDAREAYDQFYAKGQTSKLTLASLQADWSDTTTPWRKTMLKNLGLIQGRKILLLGNGTSYKEFYFLHLGADIIFTDLSLVAVRRAQAVFRTSDLSSSYSEHVEFHAVDAMNMPFPDNSIDIIYGAKFVGFLDNLPGFLSEVNRCLKPNGKCRFADDANSPAWDAVRRAIVLPIKSKFLWNKMSKLDRIRSGSQQYHPFGFKKETLQPYVTQYKFDKLIYAKEFFFLRVAQLFWGKIVRWNPKLLRYAKPVYLVLKWLDILLSKTIWMKRNALSLTWGFDK